MIDDGRSSGGATCQAVRRAIDDAWSAAPPGEVPEAPPEAAEHIERCAGCRREADAVLELDRKLSAGFEELVQMRPLPSEDRVARMLHQPVEASGAHWLRRIRRPLRASLWIAFWAFTLLAASSVIALAYRALFLSE